MIGDASRDAWDWMYLCNCIQRLTKYFEAEKVSGAGTFSTVDDSGRCWTARDLMHTHSKLRCTRCKLFFNVCIFHCRLAIVPFAEYLCLSLSLSQLFYFWCVKSFSINETWKLAKCSIYYTIRNLIISRQKCVGVCLCRYLPLKWRCAHCTLQVVSIVNTCIRFMLWIMALSKRMTMLLSLDCNGGWMSNWLFHLIVYVYLLLA